MVFLIFDKTCEKMRKKKNNRRKDGNK